MASTIKLQDSINFATQYLRLRPLAFAVTGNEPAITAANMVKGAMLGPPFAWRFNRVVLPFTLSANTQDSPQAAGTFGWIEHGSVQDGTQWKPLQPKLALSLDSSTGRPQYVSAEKDDNGGNITFRFLPVPDKNYPASLTIQQKTTLFATLSDTWSPIPDEYSYIYQWGFFALMAIFADDPRGVMANQKFVAHLLGAQQGLTATQINIFLNNWQAVTGQMIYEQDRLTQGVQARGI